ncbi:MAG: hypothetical protein M1820_006167 [Bogoriella megaspora]|nr:MAG: hypothetical protein M1820_006167 [Bogoriella megaspora]
MPSDNFKAQNNSTSSTESQTGSNGQHVQGTGTSPLEAYLRERNPAEALAAGHPENRVQRQRTLTEHVGRLMEEVEQTKDK